MRTARRGIDNRNNEQTNKNIKLPFGLHQALNTIMGYNVHADMLPIFSRNIRNICDAFGIEAES